MVESGPVFERTCRQLLDSFFQRYPSEALRLAAHRGLTILLTRRPSWPGKPGGWAAGLVYAMSSIGAGVPGVLNSDLEEALGVTMSKVYKRAARIKKIVRR